jgi:hypothetical protein
MPTTTPIEDVWADKGNLPYNAIVATADGKYPALDGSLITNIAGSGDMNASVYDPTTVAADAFAMDNMAEGSTTKILTATERSEIAANTLKTGITTAQADEIAANTLKVTYPSADSTKLAGYSPIAIITESTIARTLALTDIGGYIRLTNAASCTITLPTNATVAWASETEPPTIYFRVAAAGIPTLSNAGVTVNDTLGVVAALEEGSTFALQWVATDVWDII